MARFLNFVKTTFRTYPLIANSVIYGTLFAGSEFSQQTLTKKVLAESVEPYDTQMLAKYTLYGSFLQGPYLFTWYKWLDKRFSGKATKIIVQKVLLDQFLMTPPLLVMFYTAFSIMEMKKNVFDECKQKFLPTFKSNCMFWIPIQTINFLLVPPPFRVIYVGTCSFAWINILCWYKRQEY